MIRELGDMWDCFDKTDYFIVTTNSYIRSDGALVMGRGIAKQVKDAFPELPFEFAKEITHLGEYGVIIASTPYFKTNLGIFQVKRHYSDKAELSLIQASTDDLIDFTTIAGNVRIDMNFPGIGNGHLDYYDVLPIVNTLPDNVHVWTFPPAGDSQ